MHFLVHPDRDHSLLPELWPPDGSPSHGEIARDSPKSKDHPVLPRRAPQPVPQGFPQGVPKLPARVPQGCRKIFPVPKNLPQSGPDFTRALPRIQQCFLTGLAFRKAERKSSGVTKNKYMYIVFVTIHVYFFS